jgi:hypothetical protein
MNLYKKVEVKREDGRWHEFYVSADLDDMLEQYEVKERITELTVERDMWKELSKLNRYVTKAPPIVLVDDDVMEEFLRGVRND